MKYTLYILISLLVLQPLPLSAETRGLNVVKIMDSSGEEIGLYKESHALIIGISDYTAGWPVLPGVKKDVEAVKAGLEEQEFQVEVVENPTREELDKAFTDFINQYGQEPENRLLFYFSGHGHTLKLAYGDEMGYIVPVDAPNPYTDETGFLAKAMDMQMIEVYAKRIQAKHALFLFDSCFSGSIFSLTRAVPESISYKTAQPVRQFLTSGSAEEQVPDESIFRQQFLAALQGEGDANGDGYVTGAELGEFLQGKVVNYSKGSQHPQYGKIRHPTLDKGDFVFQLTVTVSVKKEGKTKPSTTAQATVETTAQTADPEAEMWELVKSSDDISDVKDFLEAFPDGQFSKVAQLKLKQLERQQSEQEQSETPQGDQERAITFQDNMTQLKEELESMQKELGKDLGDLDKELSGVDKEIEEGLKDIDLDLIKEGGPPPLPEPGKPPKPKPGGHRPSPPPDSAVMLVRDDILRLKGTLEQFIKKGDAKRFEENAVSLSETAIKNIDEALVVLGTVPEHKNAVETLKKIKQALPVRIEEFIVLANGGRWLALRLKLEKSLREAARAVERRARDLEKKRPPGPESKRK